jgi:hypothetical protein
VWHGVIPGGIEWHRVARRGPRGRAQDAWRTTVRSLSPGGSCIERRAQEDGAGNQGETDAMEAESTDTMYIYSVGNARRGIG